MSELRHATLRSLAGLLACFESGGLITYDGSNGLANSSTKALYTWYTRPTTIGHKSIC